LLFLLTWSATARALRLRRLRLRHVRLPAILRGQQGHGGYGKRSLGLGFAEI